MERSSLVCRWDLPLREGEVGSQAAQSERSCLPFLPTRPLAEEARPNGCRRPDNRGHDWKTALEDAAGPQSRPPRVCPPTGSRKGWPTLLARREPPARR
ncbi:hypothetical protein MRX96_030767 [Rhipicephalus microplus]